MEKHGTRKKIIASLILLLIAAVLSVAAKLAAGFAQWYSVTIYPFLQGTLGRLCGLFPFSVAEYLCLILAIAIIADAIVSIRKKMAGAWASRLLLTIAVLALLYESCCGVNYYRNTFVDRENFRSAQFTEDELAEFCEHTVAMLQDLPAGSEEYPSGKSLSEAADRSMEKLAASGDADSSRDFYDCGDLKGFYPRPKMLTYLSRFFSMMGVSGIYSPFTVEANVNGEMEGLEMPFTSCHELSHLRGFMNEGEANFIGWLACIGSDEASFNRSGWIIAWIYAGNSLYRTDPDRYFELKEKLPDDIIRELAANSEFWSSHENKASEVQDRVNDAYLRSNGQDQGIRTYNQITTLMLMWYFY